MTLSYFLAFFLLHTAHGDSLASNQCHYYQGPVGFCRDLDAANFTAILHAKKLQIDEKSIITSDKSAPNGLPSWLANFPLNFFGNMQPKNSTWTLRLPVHAKAVFLGRLKHAKLVEPALLNEADLKHRRVLGKVGGDVTKTTNCDFDPNESSFVLLVNVTDLNIHDDAWYVLCTEFNAIEEVSELQQRFERAIVNNSDSECTRCTLVKTTTQASPAPIHFLQYSWLKNEAPGKEKAAVLHYTVADLPFAAAKIVGTICSETSNNTIFQFSRSIKPRQEIFVRVPIADDSSIASGPVVKTDLYPESENGTSFEIDHMKSPVVFIDYLRQDGM